MKILFACHALTGTFLFYTFWAVSGQYYDDPTMFFKPFEFDSMLRGQYNATQCVLDLLTCWENIRPDVMCDLNKDQRYDYETYCTVLKSLCNDYLGDYDAYKHRFAAFTGYCHGHGLKGSLYFYYEWHKKAQHT